MVNVALTSSTLRGVNELYGLHSEGAPAELDHQRAIILCLLLEYGRRQPRDQLYCMRFSHKEITSDAQFVCNKSGI